MVPTRLTVWLLSSGLLLWLTGYILPLIRLPQAETWVQALRWLVYGFYAGIFLLLAIDAFLARRLSQPVRLRVRRERPARLSLGVDNEIILIVENHNRQHVRLLLRDLPPPGFRAEPSLLDAKVPAHGWSRLTYRLLPTERGNFSFGDVAVRCRGPLGLACVDRLLPAAEDVQVYPNLLEVRRYEALVRTTLVRSGGYRAKRLLGAGREFSHYREYTQDDDYRHVSWKATARRNKPITSVFESEHSQDIIFCLDIGRMMAAPWAR